MRSFCPRCDSPFSANGNHCTACGYRLQVACSSCGKPNVPQALFCGSCGHGLRWHSHLQQKWNQLVPANVQPQIRHLTAGFVFGGILFVFAFGSMGMSDPKMSRVEPTYEMQKPRSIFASPIGKKAYDSLNKAIAKETRGREATQADLVRIGNIMLEAFAPAVDPESWNANRQMMANSFRYLQSMEQTAEDLAEIPLKRGDVAVFWFRLISDLFDVAPAELSVYRYSDLPRYHYMNLPVDMLDNIGVHLAREKAVFGADDLVNIEWLAGLSVDLVKSCEKRLKGKVTQTLEASR